MKLHKSSKESSGDRMLDVLGLFTLQHPEWTVEGAAKKLRTSVPTVYRYFRSLASVGLIISISGAGYILGPRIIELDRQIRSGDPLLNAARDVMEDLIQYAAEGSIILLCRSFRDRVICIHQVIGRGPQGPISYERGRPMPLFRGATSKVILAYLPTRTLKSLYARNRAEIASAKLGDDWDTLKRGLADIRRAGVCISAGEVDPGRVGIAAPIFDKERVILGSLTFVLPGISAETALTKRLVPLTIAGANEIGEKIFAHPSPSTKTKGTE
jgi:DNA-binding IclR family transcriptional regulator